MVDKHHQPEHPHRGTSSESPRLSSHSDSANEHDEKSGSTVNHQGISSPSRGDDDQSDSEGNDYFNFNPQNHKSRPKSQMRVSYQLDPNWHSENSDTSHPDDEKYNTRPAQVRRRTSQHTHFDLDDAEAQQALRRLENARTFRSARTLSRCYSTSNPRASVYGNPRPDSMFGRQSVANVRLEDATALQRRISPTIWILVVTAAMNYTLHGFANSVTNGIITDNSFTHQFPLMDTVHTTGEQKSYNHTIQGLTVGLYQVGCGLGAFACYFLTDRIGRKPVIHILGVVCCIGIVLQCTAYNIVHLIIGRIVMGLGVGAGHATFPLYLAECVPSRIRGRSIIACAVAGNMGHFVGACVEIGFFFVTKDAQWRVPIALELVWALAGAILPFWCPESPRFLLRKARVEDCYRAQARLCGSTADDPSVVEEVKVMEEALFEAGAVDDAGKKPARLWYRVSLALFIQIMSSMSGMDVVSFFSTQTFENQLKFPALVSRIMTMGLQACQLLFSCIAVFLIDTLGRRVLLLYCSGLMAISMGALFGLVIPHATREMHKAAILFYFFTMCAYPVGYHLVPSMYSAEISPGNVRHRVCAFVGCIHFLFDFLVTIITPRAFGSIGSRYYIVYLSTNAFTFVVVYLLFVETKGIELETIEEIFEFAPSHLEIVRFGRERAALANELRDKKDDDEA